MKQLLWLNCMMLVKNLSNYYITYYKVIKNTYVMGVIKNIEQKNVR